MSSSDISILAIESSCDDTSAAVIRNGVVLSNIVAGQKVHEAYGGVVPELASRAHQANIVPVVQAALTEANVAKKELSAIAFTRGPGLPGSLMVGVSFAKGLALGLNIPLIEVHHMQAHALAHFLQVPGEVRDVPRFPFLCLTVSGGHTQIVLVRSFSHMEVVGETLDDAAGEAFDKVSKMLGLPYPGGPLIDSLAQNGNPQAFHFPHPQIKNLDYSFSGFKTSVLYFLRDRLAEDPGFIEKNRNDICASVQHCIVDILTDKLKKALKLYPVQDIALAGGVSANSRLREVFTDVAAKRGLKAFIPPFVYCTDNAGMIAIAGWQRFLAGEFTDQSVTPLTRMPM